MQLYSQRNTSKVSHKLSKGISQSKEVSLNLLWTSGTCGVPPPFLEMVWGSSSEICRISLEAFNKNTCLDPKLVGKSYAVNSTSVCFGNQCLFYPDLPSLYGNQEPHWFTLIKNLAMANINIFIYTMPN